MCAFVSSLNHSTHIPAYSRPVRFDACTCARIGNRADTSKMRRLEQALSQARSEVMQLGAKCLELEKSSNDHFAKLRAHHDA